MRFGRLSLLMSAALVVGGLAHAQTDQTVRFDISGADLTDALNQLAQQSDQQIIFASDTTKGKRAKPLHGLYPTRQALEELLKGSGLTYRVADNRTIIVSQADTSSAAPGRQEATPTQVAQTAAAQTDRVPISRPDAGLRIEEVIVTAQKRAERLQDVPVPVAVLSAETLTRSNQLRVQDYYNKVPGLSLALSGNGSEPVIAIRGVTTGGETNPTVAIVIDEVTYGSSANTGAQTPAVPDIDPGDLARVEVLRGPQGTLYGATSIGGLLKFVTVDPSTDRFSGRFQAGTSTISHSDDWGYNFRGSVNVPLSEIFAVRASGFLSEEPGYIDNAETGDKDTNIRKSFGGRLSAIWRPSDDVSVKLGALYQDAKRRGTEDVDTALGRNPAQRFLIGSGIYHRKALALSATVAADLDGVELVSATGYSKDKLTDNIDTTTLGGGFFVSLFAMQPPFSANRAVTFVQNDMEKFSQELRATFPLGERVKLLVGGFYTDEKTVRANDTQAALSSGVLRGSLYKNLYDPSAFKESAAFSTLMVDLTERFDIQLGGRYSENKQSYPLTLSGPVAAAFFGGNPVVNPPIKSEDESLTYLITPRWRIQPDLMVYARVASGYRPGGPNAACGFPLVPCQFNADTTQNYDFGLKADLLDRALSVDASVYYIDWKDIQISNINSGNATGSTYTGNLGKARSTGVEATLTARLPDDLSLTVWGSYNDAEIARNLPPGQLFGRKGDRLPYSSRFSSSASLDKTIPVGEMDLTLGATLSYVGNRKGKLQSTAVRETYPAYTQIDLRAGLISGDWSLDAFVNNVTDRRGVLRSGLDQEFIPSYATYIRPRTMGLSVARRF